MTSQKRFRHHEGNSASRFRDIPPRFKRQKSSTSPKPVEAEDQENKVEEQSTVVQSPPSACARHTMAPSNNFANTLNQQNTSLPLQGQNRTCPHPVLSQVDNYYCDAPEQHWIPMNNSQFPTTSGFVSPPLYTWESPYVSQVNPSIQQHKLYSYQPLVSRQENVSPSLQMAQVKSDDSFSGIQDNGFNYTSPSASPSPSVQQDGSRSTPDFSDPDIRTIEMLRELERVADEKEKEDENDPTVDRKNLVSHHLRMLMCAVDRYTEGIEDDDTKNASDSHAKAPSEKNSTKKKSHYQSGKTTPPKDQFSPKPNARGTFSQQAHQHNSVPAQHATWVGQGADEGGTWQTVNHSKRHSGGGQPIAYHSRTPPPPSALTRTPPPQPHTSMMSPSPHPCRTPSPYMQQPSAGTAYPMRAITKYNSNDFQGQPPQPMSPYGKQNGSVCTVSNACSPSFSPAPSPPLNSRNIWGPPGMDSPTDAKSWDLWKSPSFGPDVYKLQANDHPGSGSIPFASYVVPYAPVDLMEQLPLYRR